MRRREFILAGMAAGGAAIGLGAVTKAFGAGPATPLKPPLGVLGRLSYRGRNVELLGAKVVDELRVDGRVLSPHAFTRLNDKAWSSHLVPFQRFSTPQDLAKALLDGDGQLFKI
jgi:hypothetical protein